MIRTIRKVMQGTTQYDGAGVKLVRLIGYSTVEEFDPFLMLDAFDSEDPEDYVNGFPWHPHRGIETVTYLIKGDIEHEDSLGNKGSILDGCCQWMTAGSGIMHQEMPKCSERMLGVQLWLNLPKKDKMTASQYRDIKADMVPEIYEENCSVRIISGSYKNAKGAIQGDYVKTLFLDVDMKPGAQWKLQTDHENKLFVYIVEGEGWFEESKENLQMSRRAILFNSGDELMVRASEKGMRLFVFAGKPLQEPVAWGGPIVMNTSQELDLAFQEIEDGTFIK
ncbi:MAG TPA: pirin family protein [Lachnospiraceae bacterium]|nr:pirin family protein [Lachnospiraceae bacterium]